MKSLPAFALVSTLALASAAASAATFTLDTGGGTGSVTDITSPGSQFDLGFVLIGSDGRTNEPVMTTYTSIADSDLLVSGAFSYLTTDRDGPGFDSFGFILNGSFSNLSDGSGLASQSGEFSFHVASGDVYGWFINASDDELGPAVVSVGANLAPVPIPATLPLLGTALAGLAGLRRRRA